MTSKGQRNGNVDGSLADGKTDEMIGSQSKMAEVDDNNVDENKNAVGADDVEVVDPYETRDTQCGLGSCRPQVMRPLGSMWAFTAALSVSTIVANMNFTYYSAVITQIERRFGLSSSMTGFIKNIDNIGFMLTVLTVSHLARHANKPRLLAVSSLLSGIAIFIFATPHFMYGGPPTNVPSISDSGNAAVRWANETVNKTGSGRFEMCSSDELNGGQGGDSKTEADCSSGKPQTSSSGGYLVQFHGGAMAMFVLSEFLQGMAISPKYTMTLTYMDDNSKNKSPQHFGFMFSARAFAPMLGYLMGAWTNSLYVDLTDPGIDQKDPRWIGAWWIGFVICAVCTAVWGFPVLLFPKRLAGTPAITEQRSTTKGSDLKRKIKDLPKSCWRLMRNPVYMCCLLGGCCNITVMGFTTFLPKYYQSYFGLSPAWASVYTGVVAAVSFSVGTIISGPIVSRMKFTITRALAFVVVIHVISVIGYTIVLFLGCPEAEWAGSHGLDIGFNAELPCNANCSCDPTAYTPVCGSDGRNYFSPCYAGCKVESTVPGNFSKKEFFDCQCIEGGHAILGLCERKCSTFTIYIFVIFTTFFATSMMIVPMTTSIMRCVEDRDKSMSLAFSAFITQLAAFPAPIYYGRVIDSVCLVQQQSACDSRKGACLLYDHDNFRWRLHVLPLVAKVLSSIMYGLAFYMSRRPRYQQMMNTPTIETTVNLVDHKKPVVKAQQTAAAPAVSSDRETAS